MPPPVAILIAGEPIERVKSSRGTYPDLIRRAADGAWPHEYVDVEIRGGAALPAAQTFSGIVVTGSSSSVTDREPWVLAGEAYLRGAVAAGVPVFGICFGHQMLGQALGGRVEKNPRGREIGTVELELVADDPILGASATPLSANATHVDSITVLPRGARVLARSRLDPHAAVRFAEAAWGVQFHPEMDAEIIATYLDARRSLLEREGLDADVLLSRTDDAPAGRATLRSFLRLVASQALTARGVSNG